MNRFEDFHPAALFSSYMAILLVTMFTRHPVVLSIALVGGLLFNLTLCPFKTWLKDLGFYVVTFLLLTLMNPIFSHSGETILFFMNNRAITLEALVYGEFVAVMLIGVLVWSKCFAQVMTTDKYLYLFSRSIPKLALILTISLRYIPLFKEQTEKIRKAQKTMGLYATDSIPDKVLGSLRVYDSLIGWSLENAVEMADSMKARGYGLAGRGNFSIFHFTLEDGLLCAFALLLSLVFIWANASGYLTYSYYPYLEPLGFDNQSMIIYGLIAVMMCLPTVIEIKETIRWKYLRSKI